MASRDGYKQHPTLHDYLKNEATKTCGTGRGISDQYMFLDTFAKARDSQTASGRFKWKFGPQTSATHETIGIRGIEVKNIVEVQIGEFSMPILADVAHDETAYSGIDIEPTGALEFISYPTFSTQGWSHNPYSQTPYNGHFTIEICEFSSQSYSCLEGSRAHFDMYLKSNEATMMNPMMLCAAPKNDTFIFADPITHIGEITLAFRNPDIPLRFLPDIYYNVQIDCVEIKLEATTWTLRFNINDHDLRIGDRIYIKNCPAITGYPTLAQILNRQDGHVIGERGYVDELSTIPGIGLNFTHLNEFQLNPAPSFTTDILAGQNIRCDIYVAKRRMRIPLRMRSLLDRPTNYKLP